MSPKARNNNFIKNQLLFIVHQSAVDMYMYTNEINKLWKSRHETKNENPVSIGLWVRRAKKFSEMNLCLLLSKIVLYKKLIWNYFKLFYSKWEMNNLLSKYNSTHLKFKYIFYRDKDQFEVISDAYFVCVFVINRIKKFLLN